MFPILKCMTCKHYHSKVKWKGDLPIASCDAFPKKIPTKILAEFVSHEFPYPCDHGIQYEPASETEDK